MSNIRRVTKSTNCVDCYNNNPFQQNEGLKSYAKMISNHTNTESCKSCEPCYDPYLKKVFTEGCLTGEGTECNPLSIDLDCIPSGGVANCTLITPDCCDYILENIVFGQVCIEFLQEEYDFTEVTELSRKITLLLNNSSFQEDVQYTFDFADSPIISRDTILEQLLSLFYSQGNLATAEISGNRFCITIIKPTTLSFNITLPVPVGQDCSTFYNVDGTNVELINQCNPVGFPLYQFGCRFGIKFQINVNNAWADVTEDTLEGTWESICDTRDISSYRILNESNSVLYSGDLQPQNCRGGGEQITKSICEWIDYIYNQTSNPSSNECTIVESECIGSTRFYNKIEFTVPEEIVTSGGTGGAFYITLLATAEDYIEGSEVLNDVNDISYIVYPGNISQTLSRTEILDYIESIFTNKREDWGLIINRETGLVTLFIFPTSPNFNNRFELTIDYDGDQIPFPQTWFSNYNYLTEDTFQIINSIQIYFNFIPNEEIVFKVDILNNGNWIDKTSELSNLNEWEGSVLEGASWRTERNEDILEESPLEIECQEIEETKSFCDWISYLYNEVSEQTSENIYTSDGESTDSLRTAIFQGLKFETSSEDEYGFHIESNTINRSGFRVDAETENDQAVEIRGTSINEEGVRIVGNGTYGEGIELRAYSETEPGLVLEGGSNDADQPSILITPYLGKLIIQSIQEVTGASYFYVEDSEGYTRKIEYTSSSGENIYNSNGTLLNDRTLEGDDKSLTFTGLKSFSVNATSDAQPYSINLEGVNIGNGSGININGFGLGNGVLINGDFNDSNNAAVGISLNSVDSESGTGVNQIGIKIRGKAKTKGLEIIGNSDQNIGTSIIGTTQRDTKADEYSAGLILSGSNLSATSNDMPGLKIRGQVTGGTANHIEIVAGTEVGAGRIIISNLPTDNTALQVASKDSNDRLVWRDVSSIASSLPSNVCKMIGIDFTKTTTTTNAADQVIGHVLIPANTFGTGSSLIEVESCISRLVAGANPNHRLFINTSTSFSGATLIATINTTTALKYSKGERTFECGTNFIRGFSFTGATGIDDLGSSNVISQATIDWSVNQYILTTINNTTGETTQHEFTSVELKKV